MHDHRHHITSTMFRTQCTVLALEEVCLKCTKGYAQGHTHSACRRARQLRTVGFCCSCGNEQLGLISVGVHVVFVVAEPTPSTTDVDFRTNGLLRHSEWWCHGLSRWWHLESWWRVSLLMPHNQCRQLWEGAPFFGIVTHCRCDNSLAGGGQTSHTATVRASTHTTLGLTLVMPKRMTANRSSNQASKDDSVWLA